MACKRTLGQDRVAVAVLAVVLLAGACGQAKTDDAVASSDDVTQQGLPEDQDHPTPTPPVPELEEGCDTPPSVNAARRVASSALGMIDRVAAPTLADISAAAPTVLVGEIVGVEQGEVRPVDQDDYFPDENSPGAEPQVQLMANILLRVDHAKGPAAGDLAAQEVVAAPFTLLPQAPTDDNYAEYRDTTHANMTNELRCALPNVDAAIFVTDLGPKSAADQPRTAELPTILWSTEPAAIVLEGSTDLVSLDAAVVGDPEYFAGATTVDQLTDVLG